MDDILLSEIRLKVIAELLVSDWATFTALQKSIKASNGNLGAHVAKLVGAGYVNEEKLFVDKRPQTRYRLSAVGRDAFVKHIEELQNLLKSGEATGLPDRDPIAAVL